MSFFEQLWERKSFSYPEGAHVPTSVPKNMLEPSNTMERSALRRLSNHAASQLDVEKLLHRYSMVIADEQFKDTAAFDYEDDEDAEDEVEICHQDHIASYSQLKEDEVQTVHIKKRASFAAQTTIIPDTIDHKFPSIRVTYPDYCHGDDDGDEIEQTMSKTGHKGTSSQFKYSHESLHSDRSKENAGDYNRGEPNPILIKNTFHQKIFSLCKSKAFSGVILAIILVNTAIIIASTYSSVEAKIGWYLSVIDSIFLAIYVIELTLKLYAFRKMFFNEGWNILDFVIVIFSIIAILVPLIVQNISGLSNGAAVRSLRIFKAVKAFKALRVLRTIRFLSNLQVITATLLQSVRSIGTIVLIISLFMYMFAVIGRGIYAKADPLHFENMFTTLLTLFQLLTLDEWFEIYETVVKNDPGLWHVILYLLLYILVEYFVFLNLFVAVLVDNFQLSLEAQNASSAENDNEHDDGITTENGSSLKYKATKKAPVNSDSDSEEEYHRKDIGEYDTGLTDVGKKELSHYFSLLASLEYNTYCLQEQQRMFDMMINLCDNTNDKE